MLSPLEQFKITYLLDLSYPLIDLSFSFIGIILMIFWISLFFIRINSLSKLNYLILEIINTLNKEFLSILKINNSNYLPLILFIFIYTLICNLLGLIPYSFTLTSQISLTLLWSSSIMITVTYLGIKKHKLSFLNLFIPNGVPKLLIPYIFLIELISYLSRVLSLAIRLSTNMIAGHVLIYIISWFGYKMNLIIKGFVIIPILLLILILEIGVSIIQGYVLSVLIATYIKDSIELH